MSTFTDITFTPDGAEHYAAQVVPAMIGQPFTAKVTGTYQIDGEYVRLEAGQVVTPVGELQRLRNLEATFKKDFADLARSHETLVNKLEELKRDFENLVSANNLRYW